VSVGAGNLSPSSTRRSERLEETLGGRALETPLGETWIIEARYPVGEVYGLGRLDITTSLSSLARWSGDPSLAYTPRSAIAFLDTETTGLAGGTGTYTFLIGAGRFEGDEFYLAQFFLRDPLQEPAQLAALDAFLSPCEAVVTFNGKTFDAPLLTARYIIHSWQSPLASLTHIDLLHLSRRLWRLRLPSRTLLNLEAQILGAVRTQEDIPGWMIPQMYFDYLRSGDARPLRSVMYHNAMDVLSLVALLDHVAALLNDPLTLGQQYSADLIALGRLFEDLQDLETAAKLYINSLEHEDVAAHRLPELVLIDAIQRLALIYKRKGDWSAAIPLWEQAARRRHLEAHIELAKLYEHQFKDYALAIQWTEAALNLVNTSESIDPGETLSLTLFEQRRWLNDLKHRLDRLHQKLTHNL
jgi:hypothetical protein